jgi:hypothetical protein
VQRLAVTRPDGKEQHADTGDAPARAMREHGQKRKQKVGQFPRHQKPFMSVDFHSGAC